MTDRSDLTTVKKTVKLINKDNNRLNNAVQGGGRVGNLCNHRQAFPLHSVMASLLNSCLVREPESRGPVLSLAARPIAEIVEMVSSASPPNVSATRGTKSVPVERQAERLEDSLRWTPTCSACPQVNEDSDTMDSCSGLITWTSRAAGRPPLQR